MVEHRQLRALDFDGMGEGELVALALRGEREAFRVVMQRSNQRLFRVARAIVGDEAEAEDVVQESYARAFAKLGSFRQEASLLTWLTRITINEGRGRLRRRRTHLPLADIEAAQTREAAILAFPGGQVMEDPESEIARTQVRRLIEEAIDRLPEDFRLVFTMRDVQDCSIEETADLLGLRPETVKTRHHRARRLLRVFLHETLASTMQDAFPFLGARCARTTNAVLDRLARAYGWERASPV